MAHLAVFLFGQPRIERDSISLTVDTRKAIALLAYLVVTNERHSRDALASLLWPEYEQANARGALRRTLSALNKALDGPWLNATREAIGLHADEDLWIDVNEFRRHLAACLNHSYRSDNRYMEDCQQPLISAVALYRGDFLAGFGLRDSSFFDDWQIWQAENLRRDLAQALERLSQCSTAQADFATAIGYARRRLSLDQLHEPAHRELMLLYSWANQRSAALQQYRKCVQILQQELGVDPLEETTQLYKAIKENHAPTPLIHLPAALISASGATNSTMHAPLPPFSPHDPGSSLAALSIQETMYPFSGRSVELGTLLNAYTGISTDGLILMVKGEAGIGKTRIAEEFLTMIKAQGAKIITMHAYEGEQHLAFGPIISGLRTALVQKELWIGEVAPAALSEATRLLPEISSIHSTLPAVEPLDNPGAQYRFFEGVSQVLLAAISGTKPGVLFLDDLQWIDDASLELLTYLVRRLQKYSVCLLVTWRTNEPVGEPHLRSLESEAQRSHHATIITLERLSRESVEELVRSVIPGINGEIAERLYNETEGLPLFLVEYLTAIAKGVLLATSLDWSLPGGAQNLLRSRLATIREMAWQVLNTAAAIGRSFDFDTLHAASGRSEDETISALEELLAQHIIVESPAGTQQDSPSYDFTHEKLRSFVYEETSLARRRLLHRRIAEVLMTHARLRSIGSLAGQIARHYHLAGNDGEAAEYFRLAGEYARTLYANAAALEHLQMALALGYPAPARIHETIGDIYTLMGEYNAALKSYETAAALSDRVMLTTVELKLAGVYERRGEWESAESHLIAAFGTLTNTESMATRVRIYADWSFIMHRQGRTEEALERAYQALEIAETSGDASALAMAHNIVGILARSKQDLTVAGQHLEQSLALAHHLPDVGISIAALNNLALVYGESGAVEKALTLATSALELCYAQGDRHREAALHNNVADLMHSIGHSEDAMTHLKQAVQIYAEIGVEAGTVQPEIWKLAEW